MDFDSDDLAAVGASLLRSPEQTELAIRLRQSLELTDALWDLVPVVVAAGEQRDHMSPAEVADATPWGRRLSTDARARVREIADELQADLAVAFDAQPVDESVLASLTVTDVSSNPFGTVLGLFDISSMAASLMPGLAGAGLESLNERLYHNAYLQARFRPLRTPLLLRALAVTAVSTIEPLVTRMVQLLQFRSNPGAYASLADPALDKKTRELCYGPPDKWRRVLVDVFGISAAEQVIDWDRLGSLWNDRNIHVHRGSVVDSRGAATRGKNVGTVLNLEAKEVQAVIDEIGAARFAVVAVVWDYIAPGTGAQLSETGVPFTESMRAGRWRQAEGVARVGQTFARSPEALADARVGRWLARELGLGANAVRDEVLSWDITGLPDEYRLAQLVLLHRDDEAVTVLRKLLANGSIGRDDLDIWPLFDRLRDEGMLGDLVAAPRARGQDDTPQP